MTDTWLEAGNHRVRVRPLGERALRVTHLAAGDPGADRPWLADVLLPLTEGEGPGSQLAAEVVDGCLRVLAPDGRLVMAEARPARLGLKRWAPSVTPDFTALELRAEIDRTDAAIELAVSIEPGEGFYGWGEWFDAFRREDGRLRLHIRDAMPEIQRRNTYSAIPMYFSSRGYALWLLNSHESTWEIDAAGGELRIAAAGPGADYVVLYGPDFRDILASYTALTGRPPLLPRWALGLMVTGYPQEAQDVVLARVEEHRRRRIPLDGLILDYHWEERFHNFRWRRSLFRDPDGLIAGLSERGVRLGLIFTPFLNHTRRPAQKWLLQHVAHNTPAELMGEDERALPEFEHARAQGYLAHPNARWWLGAGGIVDFANPAGAAWWNSLLTPLYAQGAAFFKNDDGEYLPRDAASANGMDGREYHNLYGFYYGRAIYDGMQQLDQRRGFIYARSVWAGSQRYPAVFLGDQKPTFAHMASALRAGLNLGLLGFAHWTADVFGLSGKTTPELHRRYAQWALLAPVARYFWRPPGIDDTRFPWSHGPENEANFRKYAELRYRLLPYYCTLGWQAHTRGLPLMRPMLLEFQDDARMAGLDDQAMLGPSLLLAPVLAAAENENGLARRRVVLPVGDWHDFWSGQRHAGGSEISYAAPADCLPLLVRGGSIIPMGPPLAHIPDAHRFDRLELHCWPPYPARLDFFDDDGRTRAYQHGAYSVTRVSVEGSEEAGVVRLHIAAVEGGFAEQAAVRAVEVHLHASARPAAVRVNGEAARPEAWRYEADEGRLVVSLACPANAATRLEVEFRVE